MAIKFPSDEWIKQAAATWEGDCIFVILPDADYADTTYSYINLQHGKASDAQMLGSPDEKNVLFTIRTVQHMSQGPRRPAGSNPGHVLW